MQGVTTDAISATSPLGQRCAPPPRKKAFGSSVWLGRLRENTSFIALVVPAVSTIASNDRSKVRPRRVSLSTNSAPPMVVRATPAATPFCTFRFQIPPSS